MSIVYEFIVVLHLLGMAAVVGAFFVVLRRPRYVEAFFYGAVTQIVTGLALVGIRESDVLDGEGPLNHARVGVKLVISLVIAGLAWVARGKREGEVSTGLIHAIGALAIANVLIAVLWLG
jgi:hypothetical protein